MKGALSSPMLLPLPSKLGQLSAIGPNSQHRHVLITMGCQNGITTWPPDVTSHLIAFVLSPLSRKTLCSVAGVLDKMPAVTLPLSCQGAFFCQGGRMDCPLAKTWQLMERLHTKLWKVDLPESSEEPMKVDLPPRAEPSSAYCSQAVLAETQTPPHHRRGTASHPAPFRWPPQSWHWTSCPVSLAIARGIPTPGPPCGLPRNIHFLSILLVAAKPPMSPSFLSRPSLPSSRLLISSSTRGGRAGTVICWGAVLGSSVFDLPGAVGSCHSNRSRGPCGEAKDSSSQRKEAEVQHEELIFKTGKETKNNKNEQY